jgi:hypothetical protein
MVNSCLILSPLQHLVCNNCKVMNLQMQRTGELNSAQLSQAQGVHAEEQYTGFGKKAPPVERQLCIIIH